MEGHMEEQNITAGQAAAPKVSIIIPVYNAAGCIRRCADSVLNQEYTDFELLLMDDGSKDDTPAILDEIASGDSRVRVIHKPNSGVSDTRNQAISLAKGEYLQFLDADDWITADATKLFVRAAEESGADMVISNYYRVVGDRSAPKGDIIADGPITREEYAEWMLKNPADYYYGVIWNKLFKRSIVEKYHLRMDTSLNWCEDFIFNMEYILHTERIAVLQVPIYYYVKTDGSLVQKGMNIASIVQMKLNVVEYYRDFYRKLYNDEEEYLWRKPAIDSFLIAYAGDDAVIPFLPGTKKLGEERVPVEFKDSLEPNVFTDHYYSGKLLDQYLETAALQSGLDLSDVKLLQYLHYSGERKDARAAADFTGLSTPKLFVSLQKLAMKEFVSYKLDADEFQIRVELTEKSGQVIKRIEDAVSDYVQVRYGRMTEQELSDYRRHLAVQIGKVRRILGN